MRTGKGVPAMMFTALIILILLSLARARAAQVTLTWDPNLDTNVIGSFLYYGPPGAFTNRIDCGPSRTVTVTGLATNTPYAFATAAYNAAGIESDFSNELIHTITATATNPPPKTNLVQITTLLDTSTNLLDWQTLTQQWTVLLAATNPIQYFRPRSSIIQTN